MLQLSQYAHCIVYSGGAALMRENDVVSTELMGDVWPATQPGEDPVLYGHVESDLHSWPLWYR